MKEAQNLLQEALAREGEGHRLLLAGDESAARIALVETAVLYRRSWEAAPPRAFGRLVGMLKAAVLAGDAKAPAAYVRRAIGPEGDSPTSWYALGLAALVADDDAAAIHAAKAMREEADKLDTGAAPFIHTSEALTALAYRNRERYAAALDAIVADFESRDEHVTGVAIADTAVMLERLGAERGIEAAPRSPLVPRA